MDRYLRPTETIDFDHPAVREFAGESAGDGTTPTELAVNFYYAVRDGIRYDPYRIELSIEGLKASTTLSIRRGWCVPKAILLAACCRSAGIPARLGFADVRNHLSTARMRQHMKTDVFFWHGYTSIYLDGIWIKATSAFNIALCERFRLKPLEFDGRSDAIYQPFDDEGNRHMEYIRYRGEFADVPIVQIKNTFQQEYSSLLMAEDLDFEREAELEKPRDPGGGKGISLAVQGVVMDKDGAIAGIGGKNHSRKAIKTSPIRLGLWLHKATVEGAGSPVHICN